MVRGRKMMVKNPAAFGKFFRDSVAGYCAPKQVFLLPSVWDNKMVVWRKVFLLLRIRTTLVTPFYLDHLFPDLTTATFGGPWESGPQKWTLEGTYCLWKLPSGYSLGSSQMTTRVSSRSTISRACHDLTTISGLIKYVSQRGKDMLMLLHGEGWRDMGRDSVPTRQSKKWHRDMMAVMACLPTRCFVRYLPSPSTFYGVGLCLSFLYFQSYCKGLPLVWLEKIHSLFSSSHSWFVSFLFSSGPLVHLGFMVA